MRSAALIDPPIVELDDYFFYGLSNRGEAALAAAANRVAALLDHITVPLGPLSTRRRLGRPHGYDLIRLTEW